MGKGRCSQEMTKHCRRQPTHSLCTHLCSVHSNTRHLSFHSSTPQVPIHSPTHLPIHPSSICPLAIHLPIHLINHPPIHLFSIHSSAHSPTHLFILHPSLHSSHIYPPISQPLTCPPSHPPTPPPPNRPARALGVTRQPCLVESASGLKGQTLRKMEKRSEES